MSILSVSMVMQLTKHIKQTMRWTAPRRCYCHRNRRRETRLRREWFLQCFFRSIASHPRPRRVCRPFDARCKIEDILFVNTSIGAPSPSVS